MNRQRPVGVFIVRAWYEDGELRARVTRSVDVGTEPTVRLATADAAELARHLRTWLTELAARTSGPGAP